VLDVPLHTQLLKFCEHHLIVRRVYDPCM